MKDRSKARLPLAAVLFVIGCATMAKFAAGVRAVEAVGLAGAGFSMGVGFALLALGRFLRREG
jgi:hypothetical protein